ncbi:unnamed protein product, partial [Polarella glacialis]
MCSPGRVEKHQSTLPDIGSLPFCNLLSGRLTFLIDSVVTLFLKIVGVDSAPAECCRPVAFVDLLGRCVVLFPLLPDFVDDQAWCSCCCLLNRSTARFLLPGLAHFRCHDLH